MQIAGAVRCAGVGVGGSLVSNGEAVVRTGTDGHFALAVEPGVHAFVTLTVPAGMRAPSAFYRPVQPTVASYDFDLVPAPERGRAAFRLAHITDLHLGVDEARLTDAAVLANDLRDLVAQCAPDLIVASGDLTNGGTRDELEALRQVFCAVPVPVFPLFGGHDGNEERAAGEPDTTWARQFEVAFGPAWYSFDWGDRHVVLYPMEDRYFSPEDRRRKQRWLQADLALQPAERSVVLVTHTPPPRTFLEEMSRTARIDLLYGHWHSSKVFAYGRVRTVAAPPLTFGGIDTSPRGYGLLEVGQGPEARASLKALQAGALKPDTPTQLQAGRTRLRLSWEQQVDSGLHRAAPVLAGGQVLLSLSTADSPGSGGVRCLDVGSGRRAWETVTQTAVKNAVAAERGVCAALEVTGRLHLLESGSGRRRWSADLPGHPERWTFTSPAVGYGMVFAGAKAGYGAYDVDSGAQRWYTPLEASDNWSCYASPLLRRGLLVALVQRRGLVALRVDDGALAWEQLLQVEYYYATPAQAGDLLVSGGDPGHLLAVHMVSGDVLWNRPVLDGAYPTGIALAERSVYVSASDGRLRAVDLTTGEVRWTFESGPDLLDMTPYRRGGASLLAAPAARGHLVAVAGMDGVLSILRACSGEVLAQAPFGAPLCASPVWTRQGLFVATWDGRICRFG